MRNILFIVPKVYHILLFSYRKKVFPKLDIMFNIIIQSLSLQRRDREFKLFIWSINLRS